MIRLLGRSTSDPAADATTLAQCQPEVGGRSMQLGDEEADRKVPLGACASLPVQL